VTKGEAKDSTSITVHANPHRPVTLRGLKRKYAQRSQYNDKIAVSTESTQKMIKELGKSMTDSITNLMALYMFPPDTKGIQRSSDKLTSVIFQGMGYFRGMDDEVSENGMGAIRKAERKMSEVHGIVEKFFNEDWKSYREQVEAIKIKLFE